MSKPSWTAEQRQRVIELWNRGYTATQIALQPEFRGLTRNAVIGKLWRLRKREPGHFRPDRLPQPRPVRELKKRLIRRASVMTKASLSPPPPPPPRRNGGVALLDIAPNGCRFIISSDARRAPTHLYCGELVAEVGAGDPPPNCYCQFHARALTAHHD
jgi:hypothetical protein